MCGNGNVGNTSLEGWCRIAAVCGLVACCRRLLICLIRNQLELSVYTSSTSVTCCLSVCSLKCDVVMTHTPLAIAVSSMHFSLKWHNILPEMPGGLKWYTQYTVSEEQILGMIPNTAPYCKGSALISVSIFNNACTATLCVHHSWLDMHM